LIIVCAVDLVAQRAGDREIRLAQRNVAELAGWSYAVAAAGLKVLWCPVGGVDPRRVLTR